MTNSLCETLAALTAGEGRQMRIISIRPAPAGGMAKQDITVETGFLWFKRTRTFRGCCTTWHNLETGEYLKNFRLMWLLNSADWLQSQKNLEK